MCQRTGISLLRHRVLWHQGCSRSMVDQVWFVSSFTAPALRSIGLEPEGIRSISRRSRALFYQVGLVGSPYSPLRTKAKLGDWLGLFRTYPHLQDAHTNRARPIIDPLDPTAERGGICLIKNEWSTDPIVIRRASCNYRRQEQAGNDDYDSLATRRIL